MDGMIVQSAGFAHAGERLKAARVMKFRTAMAFARKSGVNSRVYHSHEAGNRPITHLSAETYAKWLGVEPSWILFGTSFRKPRNNRIMGSVGNHAEVAMFDRESLANPRMVPQIEDDLEVLEVNGDHNRPFAAAGDLVYYKPMAPAGFNPFDVHGVDAVVELDNGTMMICVPRIGEGGIARLERYDGSVIEGARIKAASIVVMVRKAHSLPATERAAA